MRPISGIFAAISRRRRSSSARFSARSVFLFGAGARQKPSFHILLPSDVLQYALEPGEIVPAGAPRRAFRSGLGAR